MAEDNQCPEELAAFPSWLSTLGLEVGVALGAVLFLAHELDEALDTVGPLPGLSA